MIKIFLLIILTNHLHAYEYSKTYEINDNSCGGVYVRITDLGNGSNKFVKTINGSTTKIKLTYIIKNGLVIKLFKHEKHIIDFENNIPKWGSWSLKHYRNRKPGIDKEFISEQKKVENIIISINTQKI